MGPGSVTIILATVFLWSVFSARLGRAGVTSAMVFVGAGFVFAEVFDVVHVSVEPELVKVVVEVTLVWVLFGDASSVRLSDFRRDLTVYMRLLGVGLPLTVVLGTLIAVALLGFDVWPALLVGAALAPTDAALGASVMSNPDVPLRIRRVLNVESGLNDGIATPIVLVAIAAVAADEGIGGVHGPGHVVVALVVGLLVGVVIGGSGGVLIRYARWKGWLSEELAGPATLALALLGYTGAVLVDGNGFVAAFVGGLVFGNTAGRRGEGGLFCRADRRPGIYALVADLRRYCGSRSWSLVRLAGHWIRTSQPYRNPDVSCRFGALGEWFRPDQRGVHRLVRPAWVDLGHLCAACPGGSGPGCARNHRDHCLDSPAQCRRARAHGEAVRETLRFAIVTLSNSNACDRRPTGHFAHAVRVSTSPPSLRAACR
jgi:Sodium/hydrogen exchanger family